MSPSSGSPTDVAPASANGRAALADAEARFVAGDVHGAVQLLSAANRAESDAALELALVRMRHAGFAATKDVQPPVEFVPVRAAAGPTAPLEPVAADTLSPDTLRRGLARNGCVLLREFVSAARIDRLVEGIDRSLAAFDAALAGAPESETAPWYAQFEPVAGEYRVGGRRNWVRKSGAMWTADSPRMLFELCELVDEIVIGGLIAGYLGERPALSANKCTLRRTPIGGSSGDWHQDGAFLGPGVRSVNLWIALADCGRDAPGLDIVPRRFDRVVPTGTGGAHFDWAVGPETVATEAGDVAPLRPEFGAGDVLLFDHLFLHRTALDPDMSRERHAMETWFFAPSTYPEGQIPLVY
jgi:hypothetical protein